MKIKHVLNGRTVEVSEIYGKTLVAAGFYEPADDSEAPQEGAPDQSPRKTRKTPENPAETLK